MSNMSYCRFENTYRDLLDCKHALKDLFEGRGDSLSDREKEAAVDLISECSAIIEAVAEYVGDEESEMCEAWFKHAIENANERTKERLNKEEEE